MNYFKELLEINKKYTKEDNYVRINDLDIVYNKLNEFYSKEFDLDEFIKLCILLFNMQIFYDGNSRTILEYIDIVLNRNNYYIDINRATDGLIRLKGLFPVMYDLDEELSDEEVNEIKQYIDIKESKKGRK